MSIYYADRVSLRELVADNGLPDESRTDNCYALSDRYSIAVEKKIPAYQADFVRKSIQPAFSLI